MAVFTIHDTDNGEGRCSDCDMIYSVIWQRNPVYEKPGHCPFCGEEIDIEYEQEQKGDHDEQR